MKRLLEKIFTDAWRVGFGVLLLLLILETIQSGFVSRFFNVNWIILFLLAVSVIILSVQSRKENEGRLRYASLQILGVMAALIVWICLPGDLRFFWRAAASGGVLVVALLSWPLINKR